MYKGIYIIENKANGKIYIGSSVNLRTRWNKHLSDLRRGIHGNPHLQAAWNQYGEESFEYRIIETMEDSVKQRELYYINYYNALDREIGYNIAKTTHCPMEGREHTEESKEKMRQAKLGENNNFYGRTHTEETKRKISEANSGRVRSKEFRLAQSKRISGAQNQNAVMTDELVVSLRKEYASLENKRGYTAKKARELGIHKSTLRRVLLGETWTHLPIFEKQTNKWGETAKLTENDVKQIRKDWEVTEHKRSFCSKQAEIYNVDRNTIRSIINNKTWKHLL